MKKHLSKLQTFIAEYNMGSVFFCLFGLTLFAALLVSIYLAAGWSALLVLGMLYIHIFMLYGKCVSTVQSINRIIKRRRAYKGVQRLLAEIKRDYLS